MILQILPIGNLVPIRRNSLKLGGWSNRLIGCSKGIPLNSDFKELLALFNEEKVRYLIVGGYAVIRYTEPRYTGDLDIFVEANVANSERVFTALRRFGAPLATLSAKDFSEPGYFFQMGMPPCRIDILMSVKGIEFSEAWSRREVANIDGLPVFFINKNDLMLTKQAAGRPKDLADLDALSKSESSSLDLDK